MYGYFIHTMELSQSISTEEFNKLKMSIRLFPENKGSDNNRWRSLDYEESGITIVIRKSSLNAFECLYRFFGCSFPLFLMRLKINRPSLHSYAHVVSLYGSNE